MRVYADLNENIGYIGATFRDCGDLVAKRMEPCGGVSLYMIYIDNMADRQTLDRQIVTPLLDGLAGRCSSGGHESYDMVIAEIRTPEVKGEAKLDAVCDAVLTGDAAIFIDGAKEAIIISSKGFKSRGVPETTTEVTVMGSREAFSEVMRTNTALIRRRVRDTRLKIKQLKLGRRSKTDAALVYLDDVVRPAILAETERAIGRIDVDSITDVGILEQLTEKSWRSPFPQMETTERPDKAAAAVMEGRIAIIVDNSPFALIVPATLNTFYQSSEDYYQRFWIMALTRLVRYAAGVFAVALPGFYVATAVFHPAMLPSMLMLKMSAARQNVPFPAVMEILLMEAAFELLREAGTRMPKAVGGTLGIVGGLIVGQAAVEAGIVSPIVVVIVALTAIASFAIPHGSLTAGYRLVKYMIILSSAALGLLGFWMAALLILSHLAGLTSYGIPYLFPFVSGDVDDTSDWKDALIRMPTRKMKTRPFFTKPGARKRMSD